MYLQHAIWLSPSTVLAIYKEPKLDCLSRHLVQSFSSTYWEYWRANAAPTGAVRMGMADQFGERKEVHS